MESKITASFGKNLKKYRELRELTQDALATKAGFTFGFISELETDRKQPSYETVAMLAKTLEVTMDQLTYGEEYPMDIAFIEDILMYRSKMSDKQRKLADHLGCKLYAELLRLEDDT